MARKKVAAAKQPVPGFNPEKAQAVAADAFVKTNGSGSATPEALAASATGSGADAAPAEERVKGPVEEVIAKRVRQLGKRIQRLHGYAQQDPASLNPDQISALQTLPTLEAVFKALEDLIKQNGPVSEAEMLALGQRRDAVVKAQEAAKEEHDAAFSAHKASTADALAKFLKLYGLLHPARPSDHSHITFEKLDLPAHLKDEVQATDVLRVGRLYDDLLAGGATAQAALDGLVAGASGDEEDAHIHYLFTLLELPAVDAVEAESVAVVEETGQDIEIPPVTGGTVVETTPAPGEGYFPPSEQVSASSKPTLNFLQDDEVEISAPSQKEDSFEMINKSEISASPAHSREPTAAEKITTYSPLPPATTRPPRPSFSAPDRPGFDWAADDEEDDLRGAFDSHPTVGQGIVEEEVVPASEVTGETREAVALAQENAPAPEAPIEAPTSVESAEAPAEVPIPTVDATIGDVHESPNGTAQRGRGGRGGRAGRGQHRPREPSQRIEVDDDGFERVVKRGSSQQQTFGRGRGGRGGQGGSGGRGRGRGGARPNGEARPNGDRPPRREFSQHAPRPSVDQAPKAPKGSIYKNPSEMGQTTKTAPAAAEGEGWTS